MANAATIRVAIVADAAAAAAGFKDAEKSVGSFEAKVQKASVLAAGALAGVGAAALDAGKAAAEYADAASAAEVIFGQDSGKYIARWSKEAAQGLGVSQQAAIDAANNFATFGKSAGLSGEELDNFAIANTALAADLASFKGTSPEEAIQAIGAAFRGESEPMRAYGVLLDDASMRQEAVRLGIAKTTADALTPQQKVLAAQALIWKQTGDAQGDFQRTSDSVANQQKIMTAEIENSKIAVGEGLQPAMAAILPYFVKAARWVGQNADLVLKLAGVVAGLSAAVLIVNGAMKAWRATQLAVTAVTKLLTAAKTAQWLATLRMRAGMLAWVAAAGIARAATAVWTAIQWAFNAAMAANPLGLVVIAIIALIAGIVLAYKKFKPFRDIVDSVFSVIKRVGIGAFNGLRSAIGWVVDKLQALWDKFVRVKDAISGGIGGIVDAITPWGMPAPAAAPMITGYAASTGGTTGTAGGPVVVVQGALDPVAVARQIRRILRAEDERSGNVSGTVWSAW